MAEFIISRTEDGKTDLAIRRVDQDPEMTVYIRRNSTVSIRVDSDNKNLENSKQEEN